MGEGRRGVDDFSDGEEGENISEYRNLLVDRRRVSHVPSTLCAPVTHTESKEWNAGVGYMGGDSGDKGSDI